MEQLQLTVWGLQRRVVKLDERVGEEQNARAALELEVNQLKQGGGAPRRGEKSSNEENEAGRDEHSERAQQRRVNEEFQEASKKQRGQRDNERAEAGRDVQNKREQQRRGEADKKQREQRARAVAEAAKKQQRLEREERRKEREREAKKERARASKEKEEHDQKTVFINVVVGQYSSQMVTIVLRNAGLVQRSDQGHRNLQEAADEIIEKVDEPEIGWARVVFLSREIAERVMRRFRVGKGQQARKLERIRMWSASEWSERRRRAQSERKHGNGPKQGSGRRRREFEECFDFRDNGRCKFEQFGRRCKFEHVARRPSYQ